MFGLNGGCLSSGEGSSTDGRSKFPQRRVQKHELKLQHSGQEAATAGQKKKMTDDGDGAFGAQTSRRKSSIFVLILVRENWNEPVLTPVRKEANILQLSALSPSRLGEFGFRSLRGRSSRAGFHSLEFQANIPTAWDGKENESENGNDPNTTPASLKESIPLKKKKKMK